jgi:hypothetical protein
VSPDYLVQILDQLLPPLPIEKKLTTVNAYPKNLVASMHALLMVRGKDAMPLRVVLDAKDFELLREKHLSELPKNQADYSDHHWAMLRLHHAVEDQRVWLSKQIRP